MLFNIFFGKKQKSFTINTFMNCIILSAQWDAEGVPSRGTSYSLTLKKALEIRVETCRCHRNTGIREKNKIIKKC